MKDEYKPRTFEQKMGYLVEECGETMAAVGKTQRWGLGSVNPELVEGDELHGETNREWVLRELVDLERAIRYARDALGDGRTTVAIDLEPDQGIRLTRLVTRPEMIATIDIAYAVSELIRTLERAYAEQAGQSEGDTLREIRHRFEDCFKISIVGEVGR